MRLELFDVLRPEHDIEAFPYAEPLQDPLRDRPGLVGRDGQPQMGQMLQHLTDTRVQICLVQRVFHIPSKIVLQNLRRPIPVLRGQQIVHQHP